MASVDGYQIHILQLPFHYAPFLEGYQENAETRPAGLSHPGEFEIAGSHTE